MLPPRMGARVTVDPESGCWLGDRLDRDGYARYASTSLHRAVWTELAGPIPPGLECDHREDQGCRSRACCYPGHIRIVTHRENVLRGNSPSAVNARKTHCDHGHAFAGENLYRAPDGHRECRTCARRRSAEYRERQRQLQFARAA